MKGTTIFDAVRTIDDVVSYGFEKYQLLNGNNRFTERLLLSLLEFFENLLRGLTLYHLLLPGL